MSKTTTRHACPCNWVPCSHIQLDRKHWRGSTNPIDFAKRRLLDRELKQLQHDLDLLVRYKWSQLEMIEIDCHTYLNNVACFPTCIPYLIVYMLRDLWSCCIISHLYAQMLIILMFRIYHMWFSCNVNMTINACFHVITCTSSVGFWQVLQELKKSFLVIQLISLIFINYLTKF
jgi:hypothetical protein